MSNVSLAPFVNCYYASKGTSGDCAAPLYLYLKHAIDTPVFSIWRVGLAPPAGEKASAPPRPSIVLILPDGLASWMLGCYGNTEIRTPNIDRLAQTGMRFKNHLTCATVSSSSRATMFTGRTPRQTGILDYLAPHPSGDPPQGQATVPASFAREVMISDILDGQGYNCGYAGEWHLGNDSLSQRGFKFWETGGGQAKGYTAEGTTAKAAQFLDRQSADQPFFLVIGYVNPHPPFTGIPQKFLDLYEGVNFETFGYEPMSPTAFRDKERFRDFLTNLRVCVASVSALDDQIPALEEELRKRNLLESTLVIFTSDSGLLLGQHGLWGRGFSANPVNMYEELVQAPMIWNWPGHVPTGNTRPELIGSYDLLPTLCELTGAPLPEGRSLCGRSYLPLVFNRKMPGKEPWRNLVFAQYRNTEMARDTRYKLVLRDEGRSPGEFYDLSVDPHEKTNQYDNPDYAAMRTQLERGLAAWREQYSSSPA